MRTLHVDARGLELNVLEWGPPDAPTVVLIHGFLDCAMSWLAVAERLAASWRVLAPDVRGHGHSGRVGAGGYYHFWDYVYDLHRVVEELGGSAPVVLAGHSMGASIVTLYAGTFPSRVGRVALLEGLGLPDEPFDAAPARMAQWVEEVDALANRPIRPLASLDDAVERLRRASPRIDPTLAQAIVRYNTREVEGGWLWRWDPLHRTRSPKPYYAREVMAFWRRLPPPVLVVRGAHSAFRVPDEAARLAALPGVRVETVDAAHNVHHEAPKAIGRLLAEHFSE